uniref:Odorant receptor 1 n=1 Tax=Macrocentrus cingulum TaxID=535359 RepID=A0A0H3U745_9HYME|nr:odorant receptor 1 [Macrocentrus cingulum]
MEQSWRASNYLTLQEFFTTMFRHLISGLAFFTLHACAHARNCRIQFIKLGRTYDKEAIVQCILRHQRLLEYSRDIEDVFSCVYLIQTVLSISVICGFSFTLLLLGKDEYIKYIVLIIGAMAQLWIYCWPPHMLIVETTLVAEAAYNLKWETWSKEQRKIVEIIIFRSQIPAKLTAGKFNTISIDTFSSICSTAMSFLRY